MSALSREERIYRDKVLSRILERKRQRRLRKRPPAQAIPPARAARSATGGSLGRSTRSVPRPPAPLVSPRPSVPTLSAPEVPEARAPEPAKKSLPIAPKAVERAARIRPVDDVFADEGGSRDRSATKVIRPSAVPPARLRKKSPRAKKAVAAPPVVKERSMTRELDGMMDELGLSTAPQKSRYSTHADEMLDSMFDLSQGVDPDNPNGLAPLECTYCGKENPLSTRRCVECNRKLNPPAVPENPPEEQDEYVYCPLCFCANYLDAANCHECDANLKDDGGEEGALNELDDLINLYDGYHEYGDEDAW